LNFNIVLKTHIFPKNIAYTLSLTNFYFAGQFTIVEEGYTTVTQSSACRRFSLSVNPYGGGLIELGHIAVHADYFSRRLMMKQAAGSNSYANLYALSGCIANVTRLCAVLLEEHQLEDGTVDFAAINSLLK
jgi:hypothetical protein